MVTSSIDLEGMAELISGLETASDCLHTTQLSLRGKADRANVPATALTYIDQIASWVDDEVPGLRRRLDLARMTDAARPTGLRGSAVTITEPVLSAAQARALGEQLAADLLTIDSTDAASGTQLHAVADRVEAYLGDPDVMAAFWAAAGPGWVDTLPDRLAATGADTAAGDFAVFSRAFTSALYDSDPPGAFTTITDAFRQAPPDPGTGWNRLALLQYGTVPTGFAQAATRANALDILRQDPVGSYDFRGTRSAADALDLPEDGLALAFQVLAKDPVAARGAISAGAGVTDLLDRVYGYAETIGTGDQVADAFGQAIEAGTGANDETMGQHTPQATTFAFQVITASTAHDQVPWTIKDSLATLAASYTPEILAGANLAEHGTDTSTMTKPDNWSDLPGLTPGFYLSLDDTYAFLRSFGDNDELSAPFDQAAGAFYVDGLGAAVRADEANGTEDFRLLARQFGYLAGLEYLAQKDVRADLDATDQAIADTLGTVFNTALAKVTPPAQVATWVWKAGVWAVKKGMTTARENASDDTRVTALEDTALQAALLREATLTQILLDNAPARAQTLPPELIAPDGGLIDPGAIAHDANLTEAFQDWVDSQNSDNDNDPATNNTDELIENASGGFSGGFQDMETWFGEV